MSSPQEQRGRAWCGLLLYYSLSFLFQASYYRFAVAFVQMPANTLLPMTLEDEPLPHL